MTDAGVPPADDASRDRSSLLLANAERERFERLLAVLARSLETCTAHEVAEALSDGACLATGGRVGWVLLPDVPLAVKGGPDARWVPDDLDPARWPAVSRALDGSPSYEPDIAVGPELAPRVAGTAAGDERAPASPRETGPPAAAATSDGRRFRSVLGLPVFGTDDAVLGALVLAHHRAHAFSSRQRSAATALCRHLGHALDMCESVVAQTRVATALQETLLPPVLPDLGGAEVAARYRPSGSGNLVGGDFYDVFADGRGGWYVLLGDASGIGPEAAGLAGVARYTARALAESADGPAEMLAQMNRALLRAAPADRFCSAVVAHLDLGAERSVTVSLASGGHPQPFLLRGGGLVEPAIVSTGTILGIVPDAPIGEGKVELDPGDAIVFYTDGVVEAHSSDGEEFGELRLVSVLEDACGRSAAGTARRVERAVVDFRARSGDDDVAVVVVRALQPAGATSA